jgi:hypothetical protein
MSANANDMSLLIKKIERRLGLLMLTPHLPKELGKEAWADVIRTDSLVQFSQFFPLRMRYICDENTVTKKDGWYYLKDEIIGNNKVLGVQDIDWQTMGSDNLSLSSMANYGYPEIYGYGYYGMSSLYADQTIGTALNTSMTSMFTAGNTIYVETEEGNPMKFRLAGISGHDLKIKTFVIWVELEHKDLATISPTKRTIFEALAQADVANFLAENLKYVDGLETIYAQIDLKLDKLREEANKRDNIIDELKNSYVTYSNVSAPLIVVN